MADLAIFQKRDHKLSRLRQGGLPYCRALLLQMCPDALNENNMLRYYVAELVLSRNLPGNMIRQSEF